MWITDVFLPRLLLFRQYCRLTFCMELVELTNSESVSDEKIQITILILRRGALSRGAPRFCTCSNFHDIWLVATPQVYSCELLQFYFSLVVSNTLDSHKLVIEGNHSLLFNFFVLMFKVVCVCAQRLWTMRCLSHQSTFSGPVRGSRLKRTNQ